MIDLDDIDHRLILALSGDARQSASALGKRFGLSQPATWRRIKRLNDAGAIAGERIDLDLEGLGFGVTVFLPRKHSHAAAQVLRQARNLKASLPEVIPA